MLTRPGNLMSATCGAARFATIAQPARTFVIRGAPRTSASRSSRRPASRCCRSSPPRCPWPNAISGLTATSPRTPPSPGVGKREPDPPTPEQAARLLNLAFEEDEEFALYLWLAFTTGGRRGELHGLRENRFDFNAQEVRFARNYIVKNGKRIDKSPKDGEGRRMSIDPLTCELFREKFRRRRDTMSGLGLTVPDDAYAFSPHPAGADAWNPDTMTHRYRRYADQIGIRSSLKELRHYSATQLLHAGVDLKHRLRQAGSRGGIYDPEVLRPVHTPG